MKMNGSPIKIMDQMHELIFRWRVHQTYSRTHKKRKIRSYKTFSKMFNAKFRIQILQITLTVSLNNYFIYFLFRNIDACITAAELEFCIEREQVEVMGISQVLIYSEKKLLL